MKIIDMLSHIGKRKGSVCYVQEVLDMMEASGVDQGMICSQLETIDNEYIFDCCQKYPDKVFGFSVINPWDIDGEAELEKCLRDYKFYGVKLNAIRFGYSADRHSVVDPFFDLCRSYGKMAVVHNMADLFSIPDKWGEIARVYPEVPTLLYHMGVPYMVDSAIELARKYDNIYLGSACSFAPAIKKAYETVGAGKLMLATDAPFVSMAQEIDKIKYVIRKDSDLELVLGGNAKKVVGLAD